MKTTMCIIAAIAALGVVANLPVSHADYIPVDFHSLHNWRFQDDNPEYPEGDVVLGGVPFSIPAGGLNTWDNFRSGFAYTSIDIPVGEYGVKSAYTLLTTDWGQPTYGWMQIEFIGSDGAYLKKDLRGDDDVRDWNMWWTDEINGVTTVNVWYDPVGYDNDPDVLDMQIFALPPDFYDEVLETIRITDERAAYNTQGGKLYGVTIADVVCDPQVYAGGPYVIEQGQDVALYGAASFLYTDAAWDLDGDSVFDDAFGLTPVLTYDYLVNDLGLTPGTYQEISLEVDGVVGSGAFVPEPTALAMLALGALALLKRKRRP